MKRVQRSTGWAAFSRPNILPRCSNCSARVGASSTVSMPARSSTASGTPRSWWHQRAMACAISALGRKSGRAAPARSRKSLPASKRPLPASVPACSGGAAERGASGMADSPSTPRAVRAVARMRTPGHAARSSDASAALAAEPAWQLSSTSRAGLLPILAATACTTPSPGLTETPRAAASMRPTWARSCTGGTSTHQAPRPPEREKPERRVVAALRARRDLPHPGGPVSVTRRTVPSFFCRSASSRSRPTKLVDSWCRLPASCVGACADC